MTWPNWIILTVLVAVGLACATSSAERVSFIGPLSINAAENYEELGAVQCSELTRSDQMEELCRAQLQVQAHELGGDTVAVERRERVDCQFGKNKGCVRLYGRAYREKSPEN